MKDLEDPYYNQILCSYPHTTTYMMANSWHALHNKLLLDKPFTFDVNPSYSTLTNNLSGSGTIYQSKL
jgi:hypothetical protein